MLRLDINLLFTVIDLLILFLGLRIFLFKPVNKIIAERQAMIDDSLTQAEAAKAEADQSLKRYEESLKNVDVERKQILDETRKNAAQEYNKIVEEAVEKASATIEEARVLAVNEKNEVLRVAQKEITDMVIDASAKVSGAKADPENDAALFDKFINEAGE